MRRYLQLINCKRVNVAGFSLIEVLVATALFAGMVSVLLSVFINAKRLAEPSLLNGSQSNLARAELEKLYNSVDENTWSLTDAGQNPLPPSDGSPVVISLPDVELNGKTFERSYSVSSVDGKTYRKVTVNVNEQDV